MRRNFTLILVFFWSIAVSAQQRDAGMWSSFSLKGDWTKKISWSLSPELRMRYNMTNVGSVFVDAGLDFDLPKKFTLSVTYRAGGRNEIDYFESRQRVQIGLGYKLEHNNWTLNMATRYQGNIQGLGSERDADFVTTWRNKITLKYGGIKKWEFASSYEFFHSYDDGQLLKWNDWRWTCSAERKINKRNYWSVGYLIQKDLVANEPNMDFVVLTSFKHTVKKRDRTSQPEP